MEHEIAYYNFHHNITGNGKTKLSEWIASKCNSTFIQATGASLQSRYIGGTPKRVRKLFEAAKDAKRAIIFIDEVN